MLHCAEATQNSFKCSLKIADRLLNTVAFDTKIITKLKPCGNLLLTWNPILWNPIVSPYRRAGKTRNTHNAIIQAGDSARQLRKQAHCLEIIAFVSGLTRTSTCFTIIKIQISLRAVNPKGTCLSNPRMQKPLSINPLNNKAFTNVVHYSFCKS